ncbi:MAG: hypothetical protein AAGA68_22535 [Pseudomonadota bacterium]
MNRIPLISKSMKLPGTASAVEDSVADDRGARVAGSRYTREWQGGDAVAAQGFSGQPPANY